MKTTVGLLIGSGFLEESDKKASRGFIHLFISYVVNAGRNPANALQIVNSTQET